MPTDMKRIITPMPDDLLAGVDDYRFERRLQSRSDAIRQLLGIALTASKLGLVRGGELHINLSRSVRAP